jgi:gluconate kinase
MKYRSGKEFLDSPQKRILLMGLSGVGKTTVARMLPDNEWFHYSVDYRLWTHHLNDQLNDYLKTLAFKEPKLRELLMKDAISVEHRVHFDNLLATSVYMGMLGNPDLGGSSLEDFTDRMAEYAEGEVKSMLDIPRFITRAQKLYGYPHFLVDASGSLCEIVDIDDVADEVLRTIDESCLIIYIEATKEHETELIRRATLDPKPIYYRKDFVQSVLPGLLEAEKVEDVIELDPKKVGANIYPKLLEHRIPRYEKIAKKYGYTVSMTEVMKTRTSDEFMALIVKTIGNS